MRLFHAPEDSGTGSRRVPPPPEWLNEGIKQGRKPTPHDLHAEAGQDIAPRKMPDSHPHPPRQDPPSVAASPSETPFPPEPPDRAPDFPGRDPLSGLEAPAAKAPVEPPAEESQVGEPPAEEPQVPPSAPPGQYRITMGSGIDSPEVNESDEWNHLFEEEEGREGFQPAEHEGITQERGSLSDPSFHQMSVAELRAAREKEAQEDGKETPEPRRTDSGEWEASKLFLSPSFEERGSGKDEVDRLAKLAGIGREDPLDAEGVPRRLPPLPAGAPDLGVEGRRVAGLIWVLLGILMGLTGYLVGAFATSTFVATPVAAVGLLLLTGTRRSGYTGLVLAVVVGIGGCALGALMLVGEEMPALLGGGTLASPAIGLGFVGFGVLFITGNLLMLLGGPRALRALASGGILIAGFLGLMAIIHTADIRPVLTPPAGAFQPSTHGSEARGFTFAKPADWAAFPWNDVLDVSPLAAGLETRPEYHFLNRNQNIMVAFYLEETPRLTLAQLLGREEPTPLEREVSRGLPARYDEPSHFTFRGHDFIENTYQGVVSSGEHLAITVARTQFGPQRSFYVVAVRDLSTRASQQDVEQALNEFYRELHLTPTT